MKWRKLEFVRKDTFNKVGRWWPLFNKQREMLDYHRRETSVLLTAYCLNSKSYLF